MEDFRNLLTITKQHQKTNKNLLEVWMEWDSNDADYIEKTETMKPEDLFGNEKLIYCLAYITCPYNFKGHDWDDAVFEHYIPENCDIDNLRDILADNGFLVYSDWGDCHSCEALEITYWDENGIPFNITFEDIYKRWEKMYYDEICNEINNAKYNDPYK